MLRSAIVACLLLANAVGTVGFQVPQEWPKFTSPEGRFSVLMPTTPKTGARDVDTAVGKLTLHTYEASSQTVYFAVAFADYPAGPADAAGIELTLDKVRDGVLKGIGAELISEKKISLGGDSGRDFTAKNTFEGNEVVYNWRLCFTGRRLYQLAAITPKNEAASPEIAKFLSSFLITR